MIPLSYFTRMLFYIHVYSLFIQPRGVKLKLRISHRLPLLIIITPVFYPWLTVLFNKTTHSVCLQKEHLFFSYTALHMVINLTQSLLSGKGAANMDMLVKKIHFWKKFDERAVRSMLWLTAANKCLC